MSESIDGNQGDGTSCGFGSYASPRLVYTAKPRSVTVAAELGAYRDDDEDRAHRPCLDEAG